MNIYQKLAVTTVGVAISSAVITPHPAYADTQVTPLFYHSNLPTTEIYNYVDKLNATYIRPLAKVPPRVRWRLITGDRYRFFINFSYVIC